MCYKVTAAHPTASAEKDKLYLDAVRDFARKLQAAEASTPYSSSS